MAEYYIGSDIASYPLLELIPSSKSTSSVKATSRVTAFGDGYQQRSPSSLYSVIEEWRVIVENLTNSECDVLEEKFRLWGCISPFAWNAYGLAPEKLYICREGWSRTFISTNVSNLEATFEEIPYRLSIV